MLLLNMENAPLNNLVAKIFDDYLEQWESAPGATSVHHAYLAGTFQHSIDTAIIAKAIATNIDGCNVDLLCSWCIIT